MMASLTYSWSKRSFKGNSNNSIHAILRCLCFVFLPWYFSASKIWKRLEPSGCPRCHKERTCPWKELSKCLPSASLLLLQSFSPRRRRRRRRRGRRCPSPRWRTSLPGRTPQTGASKTGWARSEGSLINTPSASTPPTPPTALIELWIPLNRSRVDKSWNLSWLDSLTTSYKSE